ncbi:MAG: AAA family ATPase [Anaerolineales bacterium]|nr:AAA family ATPase [Anaerolineales bacterium]
MMDNEVISKSSSSKFPEGTVTFLFTDIEGSTQLLQRLQDHYPVVLEDQRDLLRSTFERWDGCEVDTQGDSFFVAFSRASDAISAAAEAQRALTKHPWPEGERVLVRMGLHTGEATLKDGGYVGMDVHRAARLSSAGYGGQVLLSQNTYNLIERDLPDGLRVRDMGEHRLKDLRRPVRIFQLIIEDLPSDFPPIKSLDALPNNLPTHLTSFVGREEEMEKVKELLAESRMITLVGPGGAGKTRLSLQVAADIVEEFEHGAWFVELTPLTSAEYIVLSVANALKFSIDTHSSNLDPKNQLLDYMGRRSLLVVMDNFEHLLEGADLLTEMLEQAPKLKLVVTSRESLNLREEWTFNVEGMKYPTNGDGRGIEAFSALKLFQERARQTDTNFSISEENSPYVTRICQLVEGMPLAIELAAGWTSVLSCVEIAEEIEKNLDFLATSMRGIPDKHRSLRAVFSYSWGLLTEDHKAGFRKLSVFRGGFTREAAQEVADVDLLMLLDFVNKSLLHRTNQGRYETHALLQQFAEEKLALMPQEEEAVRERHCNYYLNFLEERAPLVPKEGMRHVREEMFDELGNMLTAVHWTIIHCDEDDARRALLNLSHFYGVRGWHEGADSFEDISHFLHDLWLGVDPGSPRRSVYISACIHHTFFGSQLGDKGAEQINIDLLPELRAYQLDPELALCLLNLGVCELYRGAYSEGISHLEEAASLLEKRRDEYAIVNCLAWLGWGYYELGDYNQAGVRYLEAYQLSKTQGNLLGKAYTLSKLGTHSDALQSYSQAKQYHQEAQDVFIEFGDVPGQAYALSRMSLSAWGMGAYEESRDFAQEGLEHFQSIGHRWGIATSLCRIGFAEIALGNTSEARHSFYQGLRHSLESKYLSTTIYALIGFGIVWSNEGDSERAVELLTLALNHPITPALYKDIARRELNALKTKVTEDEFAAAEERGKELDFEEIVDVVLRETRDSVD